MRTVKSKHKKAPWTEIRTPVFQAQLKRLHPRDPILDKIYHPIRAVTQTLAARKRIYNARVKQWLLEPHNRYCYAMLLFKGILKRATQCHHFRGRRRELLLDERWWIPTSAEGHAMIDANRADARELGLLCDIGEYDSPAPEVLKPKT